MKHNLTINADGVLGIGIIYHKAPVISLRNTKSTKWSRFRVFTGGTDKCLVRNTVNPLFVNAINNSKIFSTVYLYHIRVLCLVVNGFFFLNFFLCSFFNSGGFRHCCSFPGSNINCSTCLYICNIVGVIFL